MRNRLRKFIKFMHRFLFRMVPLALMVAALSAGTMMLSALSKRYGGMWEAPGWPLTVGLLLVSAGLAGVITQLVLGLVMQHDGQVDIR